MSRSVRNGCLSPLFALVALCFAWSFAALAATPAPQSLRGKLVQPKNQPPAIEIAPGKLVSLEGEPETMQVLGDARLSGADMELLGHYAAPGLFTVGPFYESKSMFIHKQGKKYTISYWCATCSIRTYTPGKCMCCQQETQLSFEEAEP